MKVFSQLVSAQLENKTADYSSGTRGRIWFRTDTSPTIVKFDDGSAIRTLVTTDNVQTLTNKVLVDSTTSIVDDGDSTKVAKFQCSGITTATTRTYTLIDETGTIISSASPPTTKGDLITRTSSAIVRIGVGSNGQVLTADSGETTGIKWATPTTEPSFPNEILNIGISATISGNALTLALKGQDGNDPSASNVVKIGYSNNSSGTSGTYTVVSTTSALSTVISAGSTGGFVSGQNEYLYVYGLLNAGATELAWSATRLDEGVLQTSTTEGGSGGADSREALYSTTGRTSKPIRLLCRLKFQLTTAGTWDSTATEISFANVKPGIMPHSSIRAYTGNGHGGGASNKIRRFTTVTATGTALTYTDDATNGAYFTVNEEGNYDCSYTDSRSGATGAHGVSINSGALTTAVNSITQTTVVVRCLTTTAIDSNCSATIRCLPGDVLRAHTAGSEDGDAYLRIIKVSE